ncbi:SDR family oxidoreductase [Myceligenerans sp. I2]|uniref:SDR family oxidoreductase n=2 Tax=Myceligenerans indicum TaxID=2593663 RepID=A0ABS1LIP3_9MICO|nr:SDR family oxidoreductase [Myceligenerans indicum]
MAARVAAHPIGRIRRPEEIADAVVWLCSERSSFVTGSVIPVDGDYAAHRPACLAWSRARLVFSQPEAAERAY